MRKTRKSRASYFLFARFNTSGTKERNVSLSNENIDYLALKTTSVFQRSVKREALQTRLSTHHVIKHVYYPRSIKLAGNLIL